MSPVGRAGGFTDPRAALPIPLDQVKSTGVFLAAQYIAHLGSGRSATPQCSITAYPYDDGTFRRYPHSGPCSISRLGIILVSLAIWENAHGTFYSASMIEATRAPPTIERVETVLAVWYGSNLGMPLSLARPLSRLMCTTYRTSSMMALPHDLKASLQLDGGTGFTRRDVIPVRATPSDRKICTWFRQNPAGLVTRSTGLWFRTHGRSSSDFVRMGRS